MDNILGGIKNSLGGSNQGSSNNAQQQQGGNQQEDYLDKAVDKAETQFGGGKLDPQKMRGTNEKVTDAARGEFEKLTGKNVPDKFSN